MSTTVTADIEVDVPVRVAYDQWTQFETFPHFMSGVESIRQLDDARTHWVVSVGGATREFDADISDQVPDDHVAWHSTTAEVDHRGRVEFRPVSADRTRVGVTLEWEPEGFVEEAGAALGGLDVFVSNASGGAGAGEEAWQANFEIDVMSAARGVEAAMPLLGASEAGAIVFVSSTAALEYLGVPQPYNAMKAALIAHASDLAQALAPRGIRVNSVSPGPIYFEGGNWQMIEQAMKPIYERALAQCAIGRMGTPEEVARAVTFLASPAASLITGANLVCDGGFTKRVQY
jgi:NAD(P)-dependent dehydrogenase (short-subunit alcohol dehydrogenase family)